MTAVYSHNSTKQTKIPKPDTKIPQFLIPKQVFTAELQNS